MARDLTPQLDRIDQLARELGHEPKMRPYYRPVDDCVVVQFEDRYIKIDYESLFVAESDSRAFDALVKMNIEAVFHPKRKQPPGMAP